MAGQRTTFSKLQRERAKKAKAAAKREKRQDKLSGVDPEEEGAVLTELADDEVELSAPRLLELIESIHKQFDAGTLSLEEFEEKKTDLLGRLPVD
ncbi:MAG: hypothetical protein ABR540_17675 [Acidimicrobiales bacterium]|nr:hypothetical protein [Actinomycetota bacterium]